MPLSNKKSIAEGYTMEIVNERRRRQCQPDYPVTTICGSHDCSLCPYCYKCSVSECHTQTCVGCAGGVSFPVFAVRRNQHVSRRISDGDIGSVPKRNAIEIIWNPAATWSPIQSIR